MGAGALVGRNTPNQDETSNFASSGPASRMVGMAGAEGTSLRRGHRQRVELAVLHLRQRRIEIVEQDLDFAAKGGLQRGAGAAERHMHHLQSGQLQNQAPASEGSAPVPDEP